MLTYTRYPALEFTHFVSKGDTSLTNWLEAVSKYGRDGMTTRELYDLRQHTNLFTNEEIDAILNIAVQNIAIHKDARKTALVVDTSAQFGLTRMYALKSEVQGVNTEARVFYTIDDAVAWLGDDVGPCLSDTLPA